jgi:hypothetical protein
MCVNVSPISPTLERLLPFIVTGERRHISTVPQKYNDIWFSFSDETPKVFSTFVMMFRVCMVIGDY